MAQTKIDLKKYQVPPERLRWRCPPEIFTFECTVGLPPVQDFIGQDRGVRSLDFGLGVDRPGYNIFVTGLTGTGKSSAIQAYINRAVEARRKGETFYPADWCYVYNFADPDQPTALQLPRGRGKELRSQIQQLLQTVRGDITKAFQSEEYSRTRKSVTEEGQSRQQEFFHSLSRRAREAGFIVEMTPGGVALFPIREGRPMTQQEFLQLEPSLRESLENQQRALMKVVEETLEQVRAVEKETYEKLHELDRKAGEATIARPFQALLDRYRDLPEVQQFLEALRGFTLENIDLFRETEARPASFIELPRPRERNLELAYQVNLFVDNSTTEGPPIVIESHPTFGNVFGKLERRAFLGTYVVDHTMLKAGAVHRANGGYLILNARDVILNPGVWDGIKRVIRTREARLEDPLEALGYLAPQGLRPQPIKVEVKFIITGDPFIYALLSQYDEDFWEMFKVKADFDFQVERKDENLQAYACFIAGCCQQENLLPFDRTGVAKVVEHAARLVADQHKLSTRFGVLKDTLIEADYWARRAGKTAVDEEAVRQAIEQKVYRSNLIEERIRQLIAEGTLMVDVGGEVVGQANGLSVMFLGDFSFGRPSRITAKTFVGRRGVINIERESQLSGRIHDKGMLILSGYLGHKYAQDKPLSLSASVCFEQSYEGVEGDSASSTELYAILSSLSGLPLRQSIAITGSVNQKGEVQPIGGVNQKVEGFYEVCKARGLTGEQGVIIPAANLRHLMLKEEVEEAVRQGKFRIYAVSTIDEGMEVLTGAPVGERVDGAYPEGTVNHLVDKRLQELAKGLRGAEKEEGGEAKEGEAKE